MKLVIGFLTLSAAMLMSTAQAASVENEYICEDAYMEVAFDCAKKAVQTEKSRLNKTYMGIYRTLTAPQKQQLDQEQIAWLKARNDKCNFEHDGPMNNSVVYAMIAADVCVANETQKRSQYFINEFDASKLLTNNVTPFQKVRTASEGYITYYQGETTVSGTIDITDPNDEYTPCGLCFSVDERDASKIPRELGDDRSPWFAFDNSNYNEANKTYELGSLKVRADKCYEPIKATIKIRGYMADRTPTETVDQTTLIDIVAIDKPKMITCPPSQW